MVITCDDFIYNDFKMTDYGLISGNGSDGMIDDTEDMSITPSSTVVFNGESPRSSFISQKYESNPEATIKMSKSDCGSVDYRFSENELRNLNRMLTGKPGYSWLKIVNNKAMETDFYYRARVSRIEYERLGFDIVGYNVTFECDGGYAYSEEQIVTISAKANNAFYVFNNSDDLYDYEFPVVTITASTAGTLTLKNTTDSSWTSQIKINAAGEIITMDSKNDLLKSSRTRTYILNDFNLHWPRLMPGKNSYICSQNATITFKFRAARKVGFVS